MSIICVSHFYVNQVYIIYKLPLSCSIKNNQLIKIINSFQIPSGYEHLKVNNDINLIV